MSEDRGTHRVDAFADAAFAFAASLLLLGGERLPDDYAQMRGALASIPAFAFGFAIIAMFWFAHVRWRRIAAVPSAVTTFFTLVLVFLVLVYVIPLRLFAAATTSFFGLGATADGIPTTDLPAMFLIYGIGFAAMALTTAALFAAARRGPNPGLARVEMVIHLILAGAGVISAILAATPGTALFAAWAYALIGPAIGIFHLADRGRTRRALPPQETSG